MVHWVVLHVKYTGETLLSLNIWSTMKQESGKSGEITFNKCNKLHAQGLKKVVIGLFVPPTWSLLTCR